TGRLIISRIIPTINTLRQHFPLSMATMFPLEFLLDNLLDCNVDCGDLEASDTFLACI
ncbi:hypothetical protein BJ138DRAFT_989389, partial [Hygrophoropsis aurantiaca]